MTMNGLYAIRKPRIEDVDAITAHHHASWLATYPHESEGISRKHIEALLRKGMLSPEGRERKLKRLKEYIAAPDRTTYYRVATDDSGKIVGHIVGQKTAEGQEMASMYLDVSAQGTGLAQDLFAGFLDWADDALPIELDVVSYNQRAIRFYERQGFVKVPGSDYIHHSGMPSHKMRREASSG